MAGMMSEAQRLSSLPSGEFWQGITCAVFESPDNVRMMPLTYSEDLPAELNNSSAGLAFGPGAQLRWTKRDAGYHAVLISDRGHVLNGCADPCALTAEAEPEHVFLWGRRAGNLLFEDRIPREFAVGVQDASLLYPPGTQLPPDKSRLRLIVQWYTFPYTRPFMAEDGVRTITGLAHVSRWVRVAP